MTKSNIEHSLGIPDSELEVVQAGKVSETFFWRHNGELQVLRVTDEDESYRKDQYANELFANTAVPVPPIHKLGQLDDGRYYALSEYVPGVSSDKLPQHEIDTALPVIWSVYAEIFKTPIGSTTGYGYLDASSHNGESETWRSHILNYTENRSVEVWEQYATTTGLDPALIKLFIDQIHANIDAVPEIRQLFHGDLGFDNLLMQDDKVTAVIDWAQMGYGDWYYDFATMEFWWPGRYGDAHKFAAQYGFNADNLEQRKAAYWARRFFGTLNFAVNKQNHETLEWLRKYAADRLVTTEVK